MSRVTTRTVQGRDGGYPWPVMRRSLCILAGLVFAAPVGAQEPPAPAPLQALGSAGGRTLGLWWTRTHNTDLANTDIYHAVWLREASAPDSVVFDLVPFATPPREGDGVALAYDQGLGGRMWSGVHDRDLLAGALYGASARLLVQLWRMLAPPPSEEGELVGRRGKPGLLIRFGGEAPYAFASDGRDVDPLTRMAIGYADLDLPVAGSWRLTAGLRGYLSRIPGRADRHDLSAIVRVGRGPPAPGIHTYTELNWTPGWRRIAVHIERPFRLSTVDLRPALRLGAGDRVPFALGFWPGGGDGFPGLDPGEGRGDREASLALHASRPVGHRLTLHATVAFGHTSLGGPLIPAKGWVGGIRAGLGLETRFGTIRLEPGITNDGRTGVFLRLGPWL